MRLRISLQLEIGLMRNSDSLDVPDKMIKQKHIAILHRNIMKALDSTPQ